MTICRTLGFRSVDEAERSLTAEEWATWQELYNLDPWGTERLDWLAGMICQNVKVGWAGRSTLMEHMPFQKQYEAEPEEGGQSLEAMQSIWVQAVESFNGAITDGE